MAKNDILSKKLMEKSIWKEEAKQNQKRPSAVEAIATGEDAKPDFMKMAKELEAQKEERKSELEDYTKDTIYIRTDLFNALQALCEKQGDKKRLVNQMYEEFLSKKYRELKIDN